MHIIRSRKAYIILAGLLITCAAVAVAAVMLSGQKGKGTGHFQQLQNISVTAGAAPGTGPYAVAGSDGDLGVKLSNPNGVPIKVVSIQRDAGGGQISSTDSVGCSNLDSALSVNSVTLTATQQTAATVAAGASNVAITLPGVIHVVSSPGAACQAADFNVPLDLTVQAG